MKIFRHHIRHKIADTHDSDISIRNVPAHHPLFSEFKFIDNIPKLLPLFVQQNTGVINDKDIDLSSTSYSSDNTVSKTQIKRYGRQIQSKVIGLVAKKPLSQIKTVTHSPFALHPKINIPTNQLRDVHRMVCEARKTTRQFVFANSGGGRHHKKNIRRNKTSYVWC